MESYKELQSRQSNEFSELPIFWAFNNEQFIKGMESLGLKETDKEQVCQIMRGGVCKKSDRQNVIDMLKRHTKEHKTAIEADETGNGYIFEMFDYELSNHEYTYTHDIEPTLDALGLTKEYIEQSAAIKAGMQKAINEQLKRQDI